MKIITLGKSPYLMTSHACAHKWIIEHLFLSGYSIASMVSDHDTKYFVPEEVEGVKLFCYNFDKYKIPIIPFDKSKQPEIPTYEILNGHKPDLVITVGDYNDFLFMKAVKMFCETKFKWIFVLMNHTNPINEKNLELLDDIDGIVCTNMKSYNMFKDLFAKDSNSICHCSVGTKEFDHKDRDELRRSMGVQGTFRIITCGKNAQIDNLPTLMQAVSELKSDIPNIQLYLHTNYYDAGDFDFQILKERFDPKDEFIRFPSKYVSLIDGYSRGKYGDELFCSDLFVSISMNSSSGMSVYDAMACGCPPLMSDTGAHMDIATLIGDSSVKLDRNDVLVPCIKLITAGECYLDVCDSERLKRSILSIYRKIVKKAGYRESLVELIKNRKQKDFTDCIVKIIMDMSKAESAIYLEPIGDSHHG